jgi:Bacterial mobilisation protein (MobC)
MEINENKENKNKKDKKKRAWKSESLPRVFTVRTNDEKYRRLKALSVRTKMSLSRMLVEATLHCGLKSPEQSYEEKRLNESMLFEVRKIGVNLNQIAHTLHSSKYVAGVSVSALEIDNVFRKIEEVVFLLSKQINKK